MHITTSITQSSSSLTTAHTQTDNQSILPRNLNKVLSKKAFSKEVTSHSQKDTHAFMPLSSQLMRMVDACGDCV